MKRPNYVLRLLAVAALLATMLVGTAATTFASPPPSGGTAAQWDGSTSPKLYGANESDQSDTAFQDGAQEVYFASVANGVDFGLGAASTSITVQNIDVDDAYVFFWIGGDWDLDMTTYLGAGASKTFTAADLGIAEGEDVPVVAALYNQLGSVCAAGDLNGDGDCNDQDVPQEGGGTRDEFRSTLEVPVYGAGVAKQAVAGTDLPYTSDADTSVSGYNAVSGREVGFWDDLYFPIVQTNCGPGGCWDTNMVVANVGMDNNAAVTISFFAADDGSGSLQTGFQIQKLLNAGDSWSVNLSTLVPEGWVGTAHIYTDDAVVAIANRFKAGTDMWITNTASNAVSESDWQNLGVVTPTGNVPYILFAPDVRTDWNGWNVGINVSNTVDADNHVYIQYAGIGGNAPQGLDRRIAAQGMTYFYNPSDPSEDNCAQPATQVPTCEFIGAAVILSEFPVTAAVDGVKYFGDDNNVGQAFSYAATGNIYNYQSAPLIQKGTASTGMGATSGINFLNPNAGATVVQVRWVNPSGYTASNFSDSIVWVPGFSTGFVYTMNSGNLPNGFLGSAAVASTLPIAATTANVDYAVSGDGTAVWNLYNPCGFFRQDGDCDLGNILGPVVANSSITVTVDCPTCTDAAALDDVTITVTGTDVNGFDFTATSLPGDVTCDVTDDMGTTDPADDVVDPTTCTVDLTVAVPAGTYTVTVNAPAGYHTTAGSPQTVTVGANEDANVNATIAPTSVAPGDTGTLTKRLLVDPALAVGIESGDLSLNSGVVFCAGADLDLDTCDPFTPGGSNAHGGFFDDTVVGIALSTGDLTFVSESTAGSTVKFTGADAAVYYLVFDPSDMTVAPQLYAASQVTVDATTGEATPIADAATTDFDAFFDFSVSGLAVGDYTVCSTARITGDFGGLNTNETVGFQPMCENATVTAGEETIVNNDFETLATGSLDVFVYDAIASVFSPDAAIEGATVCARDEALGIVDCDTTDANGAAHLNVPSGTYIVTSVAPGFEGEDQSVTYSVTEDITDGTPLVDTSATAELKQGITESPVNVAVIVTGASGQALAGAEVDVVCTSGYTTTVETTATGQANIGFPMSDTDDSCTFTVYDDNGDVLGSTVMAVPAGTTSLNVAISTTAVNVSVANLIDCLDDGTTVAANSADDEVSVCDANQEVWYAYDDANNTATGDYVDTGDKDENGVATLVVPANSTYTVDATYGTFDFTTFTVTYFTGTTDVTVGTANEETSVTLTPPAQP